MYGLAAFGVTIVLIAPPGLELPQEEMWRLQHLYNADVTCVEEPSEVIQDLDVLYVNRLQTERLPDDMDPVEVQKIAARYRIDAELIKRAKSDCIVLYPLPRVDELARELDSDPRTAYFGQSSNGVPVRMALLAVLMERVDRPGFAGVGRSVTEQEHPMCGAAECVTQNEPRVTPLTETVAGPSEKHACNYCGRFAEVG